MIDALSLTREHAVVAVVPGTRKNVILGAPKVKHRLFRDNRTANLIASKM